MKAGGALLVVTGIWVLAQVLAGNALTRLGIVSASPAAGSDSDLVPPSSVPHDAQGRPL